MQTFNYKRGKVFTNVNKLLLYLFYIYIVYIVYIVCNDKKIIVKYKLKSNIIKMTKYIVFITDPEYFRVK